MNSIPLSRAFLCVNCEQVSEAKHEACPVCGSVTLLSLARILNPSPELGQVTFILAA
jgi:hypothetical protein